jgi:hypothetical protein
MPARCWPAAARPAARWATCGGPEAILDRPKTRALIDFTKPVGLLLVAILHFIPDEDDPRRIPGVLRDALPPGSFPVLSHVTGDFRTEAAAR